MAEKAMTGQDSKNCCQRKQQLVCYIEFCSGGTVMAAVHRRETLTLVLQSGLHESLV